MDRQITEAIKQMKAQRLLISMLIVLPSITCSAQQQSGGGTRCLAAGHWIGQEVISQPNSKGPDGTPIQLKFPLSVVVSPAGDQVFFQIQGSAGRTWSTTNRTRRRIMWGNSELVAYPGVGKALTKMRMSLTADLDGASATLSGSHSVLDGPAKGVYDSLVSGTLHKVEGQSAKESRTASASGTADDYPVARPTAIQGIVLSPFPPYNLIRVDGVPRGGLVLDPSCGKVFRSP
jgi:hypothetical protein